MRRSDQPGAGKHANTRQGIERIIRSTSRRRALGENVFSAIVDEANFMSGPEWEPGTPVRLLKEGSERLATGELLPGQAALSYGTVVRNFKKYNNQEDRRLGRGGVWRVVVKLVNGTEVVTTQTNLERVTTLDLLAAASDGE